MHDLGLIVEKCYKSAKNIFHPTSIFFLSNFPLLKAFDAKSIFQQGKSFELDRFVFIIKYKYILFITRKFVKHRTFVGRMILIIKYLNFVFFNQLIKTRVIKTLSVYQYRNLDGIYGLTSCFRVRVAGRS